MQSFFYGKVFPATRLSPIKQSVNDFVPLKQDFRMATSVGGILTVVALTLSSSMVRSSRMMLCRRRGETP